MKHSRRRFSLAVIVGAVLAAIGLACPDMASAQIRPAYVKNVDEPGRVPYQQMVQFNTGPPTCPLAGACIVEFAPVPAGKRLVVESATMLIAVSGGQPGIFAFGDSACTNCGNLAIISNAFTSTGIGLFGATFFSIDRPVRVYFGPTEVPKLKVLATGGSFAFVGNASLHGYLIDATN